MAIPINISSNPSLNEIVSSLAARVDKVDDPNFLEELKHIVNYKRKEALYIWMTKLNMKQFLQQTVLVNMTRTDATECANFASDCTILKSECQIPSPFRDPRMKVPHYQFDYVGHQSGYEGYMYLDRSHLAFNRYRPYTANSKKWFYSDGFLYIISHKTLPEESIMLRAVFEDPFAAYNCNACDPGRAVCIPDDEPYPVPGELLSEIIKSIISVELGRGPIPSDEEVHEDQIKTDTVEQTVHNNT